MLKILVALDESAISRRAAREAVRLFPDAEFLVVNVTRRVVAWMAGDAFGTVSPTMAPDLLPPTVPEEEITGWAETAGIDDADVMQIEGDPAAAICDAAHLHDVDVVVVGSHDKGVLRRLLDPSVAQAVVQGTYKPVLVVSGTPPDA